MTQRPRPGLCRAGALSVCLPGASLPSAFLCAVSHAYTSLLPHCLSHPAHVAMRPTHPPADASGAYCLRFGFSTVEAKWFGRWDTRSGACRPQRASLLPLLHVAAATAALCTHPAACSARSTAVRVSLSSLHHALACCRVEGEEREDLHLLPAGWRPGSSQQQRRAQDADVASEVSRAQQRLPLEAPLSCVRLLRTAAC